MQVNILNSIFENDELCSWNIISLEHRELSYNINAIQETIQTHIIFTAKYNIYNLTRTKGSLGEAQEHFSVDLTRIKLQTLIMITPGLRS